MKIQRDNLRLFFSLSLFSSHHPLQYYYSRFFLCSVLFLGEGFYKSVEKITQKNATHTHIYKSQRLSSLSLSVTHTRSNYLMYYYYCCWCCCYSFFPPFPSYPKWDLITLAHSLLLRCWRLREEERKKIYIYKIKDSRPSSSVTETHNIVYSSSCYLFHNSTFLVSYLK